MGVRRTFDEGQMAVELAVVMPVLMALCIICIDLGVFMGDCARFDRLAPQIIRAHACSPASDSYAASAVDAAIRSDLEEAMGGNGRIEVTVSSQGLLSEAAGTDLVSFVPQPMRFTCTLTFHPWPFSSGGFGVHVSGLTHETRYVVDPYRPGVLG